MLPWVRSNRQFISPRVRWCYFTNSVYSSILSTQLLEQLYTITIGAKQYATKAPPILLIRNIIGVSIHCELCMTAQLKNEITILIAKPTGLLNYQSNKSRMWPMCNHLSTLLQFFNTSCKILQTYIGPYIAYTYTWVSSSR